MHNHPFMCRAILTGAALVVTSFFASSALAAEKSQTASTTPPVVSATNSVAAGSIEDSLQACMARIPKDATAGQRMIAEQSCRRDEGDRKPYQATGGR
jgi:hypothetical protein